ncbi:MAG TPA: NADH-quinone oxidoreductase subunit N [Nitrospirota bacterium]|nr:NADH-quinone oxidoreductase subunit N [Nitrospirota bacterium]
MNSQDIKALMPLLIVLATVVIVMLGIAFRRSHRLAAALTLGGLALAAASLPLVAVMAPQQVGDLIIVDRFALFLLGLILCSGLAIAALSYSYLEMQSGPHEEYYLLLLTAVMGSAVLAVSTHFASFFLGIEILSVSLYALAAYQRHNERGVEAGVKYLILAAVSSAFILFGMALVYAAVGIMEFSQIAYRASEPGAHGLVVTSGIVLILAGLGFKLAAVPFHLWTPDVYEGAPAPVTAFIATISKGAVFALVLRFFSHTGFRPGSALFTVVTIIAISSMFAGNLLALLQRNVKRLLAYSSISHMGYLLVTLLAAGPLGTGAASFYLAAYFVTTLGAFGVVTILSTRDRDADRLEDYQGLAWRRPWLAGVFTLMLFSLAGIPLTAGFIGKFYVAAAGVGSGLWLLVVALVINSALGLFYYLRVIVALYSQADASQPSGEPASRLGNAVLAVLAVLLVWLGVYPGPLLAIIQRVIGRT